MSHRAYGRAELCLGLALVALAAARCSKMEPGFRIVPTGGTIWLSTEIGAASVDGLTTDVPQDGVLQLTVCAADHDNFPVAKNTAVWVQVSSGWLSVVDGIEHLEPKSGSVGCLGSSAAELEEDGSDPAQDSETQDDPDASSETDASEDTDAGAASSDSEADDEEATLTDDEVEGERRSTVVVSSYTADGCALLAFHAPVIPASVTLAAWSGDVEAQTRTIEVVQVHDELAATVVPAVLGPDGGTATVLVELRDQAGKTLADGDVFATTSHGEFVGATEQSTNSSGQASFVLEVEKDASVNLRSGGQFATVDFVAQVTVERPVLASIDPTSLVWSLSAPPDGRGLALLGTGFSEQPVVELGEASVEVVERASTKVEVEVPDPTERLTAEQIESLSGTGAGDDTDPGAGGNAPAPVRLCEPVQLRNPSGYETVTIDFCYEVVP
jgi:hypothetical protein